MNGIKFETREFIHYLCDVYEPDWSLTLEMLIENIVDYVLHNCEDEEDFVNTMCDILPGRIYTDDVRRYITETN